MGGSRVTEERIIAVLAERERGSPTAAVCRRHGIGDTTLQEWKAERGGMPVSDARRPRSFEDESARLERLPADPTLDGAVLEDPAREGAEGAVGAAGGGPWRAMRGHALSARAARVA